MFHEEGRCPSRCQARRCPAQYREIEAASAIIRESAPSLEPIVRWEFPFYVKDSEHLLHQTRQGLHRIRFCRGRESRSRGGRERAPRSRGPSPHWTAPPKPRFASSSRRRSSDLGHVSGRGPGPAGRASQSLPYDEHRPALEICGAPRGSRCAWRRAPRFPENAVLAADYRRRPANERHAPPRWWRFASLSGFA